MLHLNISESRCSFFPSFKVLNLHNTERPLYQCCTHCVIFSTLGPNQSFDVAASRATSTPTYSPRVLQTSTKGKDFTSCILHMLSRVKACAIVNCEHYELLMAYKMPQQSAEFAAHTSQQRLWC